MTEEQQMEAEANAFAMELLMPPQLLLADIRKRGGIDVADDNAVTELARRYRVPVAAMAFRIGELSEQIAQSMDIAKGPSGE